MRLLFYPSALPYTEKFFMSSEAQLALNKDCGTAVFKLIFLDVVKL